MYNFLPNTTLGFHGCDRAIAEQLLTKPDEIKMSREKFDWLGHGMYFWENNIERARLWAENKKARGRIKDAAVIGAVLQLGHCCDLLNSSNIQTLTLCHDVMNKSYTEMGIPMPSNKDLPSDRNNDKILRVLDCAVIEFMHNEIYNQVVTAEQTNTYSDIRLFDSVRSVFIEGGPAFEGAGILEKTHIQICVRNPNCIKGFFLPRKETDFREWLALQNN